jgi:hypothetical protein
MMEEVPDVPIVLDVPNVSEDSNREYCNLFHYWNDWNHWNGWNTFITGTIW